MNREGRTDTRKQNFLRGAFNLSVATLVVKIIGALYKIPIQNMLSEAGGGHFKSAYNVYSTLFVLATAGIPVALSKMVSEAESSRSGETRRIYGVARPLFLLVGGLSALVMFLSADWVAALLNNPAAAWGIRAISPAVFFAGVMAPLRGVFQGKGDMTPTAVSQVLEGAGKLIAGTGLTFLTLTVILPPGSPQQDRDIFGAAAAILGVTCGMMLSAIYLLCRGRRDGLREPEPASARPLRRRRAIAKEMFLLAVPITLSSSVLSFTNLIDDSLVRSRLLTGAGFPLAQVDSYMGIYGLASTLFNLPSAFILTLAVSLLPVITAYRVKGNREGVARTVRSATRVSLLLSMPAGAGFVCLAEPILRLLYPSHADSVAISAPLLQMLGVAVLFSGVVTVTNAILQSLGRVNVPMVTMLIGGALKVICTLLLVGDPAIHIMGAPFGTVVCLAVISVLNLAVIIRVSGAGLRLLGEFVRPMLASAGMGFIARGCYLFFEIRIGARPGAVAAIFLGALAYFALLLLVRAVPREDMELLPGGEKIAKILRIP